MEVSIRRAAIEDIQELTPLFDAYRVFYKQESNLEGARFFLEARIHSKEAVIFLAYWDNKAVGFTQLYPSYSSVSLQSVLILNDLYVDQSYRKKGIGEALLDRAKEFCIEKKCKGLALETAIDNPAQHLYERLNWKKDLHCFHYFWAAE
ncbi:GNAT family N-acetyltransferase [Spongiimicrobium salis]|uniref:GNAT family N-acetyltransferase n=1 Tax=Spongiimicrobium salis TaxID=1667022 RepID=UPI00374D88BD